MRTDQLPSRGTESAAPPQSGTMPFLRIEVEYLFDEVRAHFPVIDLRPRAHRHKLYQIEVRAVCTHEVTDHKSAIGPIDHYRFQDGQELVISRAWNQRNAYLEGAPKVEGQALHRVEK